MNGLIGVYILKGSRFYVGSTNNLKRRLEEHKNGKTHATKRIGDFSLIKFFPCSNLEQARLLESKIKCSKNIKGG